MSDESGEADVVIDPKTATKRATIRLGGEAGNTHYDRLALILVRQTRISSWRSIQ